MTTHTLAFLAGLIAGMYLGAWIVSEPVPTRTSGAHVTYRWPPGPLS